MGFTVTHLGETRDVEFEAYPRLLRQKGVDLAKLNRVPEPGTSRRWLYVWTVEAEAQAFADELRKRTRDNAWGVVRVESPPSEGPLGPVEIQVGRQSNGWTFTLHPFSRQMLQEVFPGSCRIPSLFLATDIRQDVQITLGDLGDFAEQVAILLTGISIDQLTDKFGGYRVYEPATKKELVSSQKVQA